MVKISEVHPTLRRSMETTIRILEAAIELRKKEIVNMQECVRQCHKVMADEVLPANEHSSELVVNFQQEEISELTILQRAMKRVDHEQQEHTNGGLDR